MGVGLVGVELPCLGLENRIGGSDRADSSGRLAPGDADRRTLEVSLAAGLPSGLYEGAVTHQTNPIAHHLVPLEAWQAALAEERFEGRIEVR